MKEMTRASSCNHPLRNEFLGKLRQNAFILDTRVFTSQQLLLMKTSPPGWVEGVFSGKDSRERVRKCTFKQCRQGPFEGYFTESEFEYMLIEVHQFCRRSQCGRTSRIPFFCMYCEENFKDKGTLSYHRIKNECSKRPPGGGQYLKMYPFCDKTEIKAVFEKHKLQYPVLPPPPPPEDDDAAATLGQDFKVLHRLKGESEKQKEWVHGVKEMKRKEKVDKSKVKSSKKDNMEAKGTGVSSPLVDSETDTNFEDTPRQQKKFRREKEQCSIEPRLPQVNRAKPQEANFLAGPSQQSSTIHPTKTKLLPLHSVPDCKEAHAVPTIPSLKPHRALPEMELSLPKTREELEANARRAAQKKFPLELNVGNDANLSPLVDCCPPSGLYLLAEHTSEIINSELLKDLQAAMEAMLSLQSQDILAERIFKAYGQYLFCTDVGAPGSTNNDQYIVKTVKAFQKKHGEADPLAREEEIKAFQLYLTAKGKQQELWDAVEAKNHLMLTKQDEFVRKELEKWDKAECMKKESNNWGWSPLFQFLKMNSITSGPTLMWTPSAPWQHTSEELLALVEACDVTASEDIPCPPLVRVLKLIQFSTVGGLVPLCCPFRGLSKQKIAHVLLNQRESVHFTIAVDNLIDVGFLYFPHMDMNDNIAEGIRKNLLGLLGYLSSSQEELIDLTWRWLVRSFCRAVVDMVKMGQRIELELLWFRPVEGPNEVAGKQEATAVFYDVLQMRESLDMGWIFVQSADYNQDHKDKLIEALRGFHTATANFTQSVLATQPPPTSTVCGAADSMEGGVVPAVTDVTNVTPDIGTLLPEWSLTPVGNFMDMLKDSQTVPIHDEGRAGPPVEIPMHSSVMPSTDKHILDWHVLQPGALYPDLGGDAGLQGSPCKTWSRTKPKTLPYIAHGLGLHLGIRAGSSMRLMPDLNAWQESDVRNDTYYAAFGVQAVSLSAIANP